MITLFIAESYGQENENRFGFELSSGLTSPTKKMGEISLKNGIGFEGVFQYRFLKHTAAYVGWGWNKFSSENSFLGNDLDFEETGYVYGLEYNHPFKNSNLSYFVRVGGLYNHIEIENNDGDIIEDTGHGFGYQLAGGLEIPLNSNWSLLPGIKFNSLDRNLEIENEDISLNLNYICYRISILKRF